MATLDDALNHLKAELDQLKAQQALLTKSTRQILEGKLEGADGAAGTLVALEGGQTSIDVQLLAKSEGE